MEKAQALLLAVEEECNRIGLQLNAKKTKVIALNTEDSRVTTREGTVLDVVEDFKYLGAYIASTENDIKVRRALAWSALHDMKKVWKSNLPDDFKRRLFVATIESVLLYGAETWTLTVQQEKALDGVYTRLLRMALNVTWEDHIRNIDLYGNLQRVSAKLRSRRMGFAGHCVRHPEMAVQPLVLWEPTHGTSRRGRRRTTYVDTLKRDVWGTGAETSTRELRTLMEDRVEWRRASAVSRVGVG